MATTASDLPPDTDTTTHLKLLTPPFSGAYVSLDSSAVSFDSFRGAADPSV